MRYVNSFVRTNDSCYHLFCSASQSAVQQVSEGCKWLVLAFLLQEVFAMPPLFHCVSVLSTGLPAGRLP